uniref:Aminopeptidase N n=1 Tax=Tetraselmis sp. GSL018 TaxID=582737 RepID=A0A061S086_9CHLO|eukprot:CAMPEP_0177606354 /NCGR_PEP_ID=MMETSP0419_2-20121207/17259_1 /TAXON_ID=582737 /ORGANISM="Tetraselmis sp., Strain GSL018" /LENGTH=891 /DNA_ID=CAMNT_0019100703 /DNA_START=375 /DNA_END=3050 /DNA_ORIENTATION=-
MAESTAPTPVFRKDYAPYPYKLEEVSFKFELSEEQTTVSGEYKVAPSYEGSPPPMVLDGVCVNLMSIKIDGADLLPEAYTMQDKKMIINSPPEGEFTLAMVTEIKPQENTSCEGLYKSSGNFCTQCEAEGFRRIIYFPDRPDVMSKYTVRIEADKELYPVLLSNGNLAESGDMENNRHYAVWVDPFKKPCYLFALVAGRLKHIEDSFTTQSGRQVKLRIFVEEPNLPKCGFAMESLKKAMKWDEDTFGLEYDLDLFNIVAVHDFNMGAMENKSLNIFNSRLILASPETATDSDYSRIEGVVGHEYFHNWTGNRVTCRDWFQLTLKEGLTVYRDQEFTSDLNSRPVKRIEDVIRLRSSQFTEDAGPMRHPVRPESYIKMENFYTVTVYEKGAEVIRMYATLLGKEGFRKGMDLYFERHDGQAVTCDDFLAAMADANGADLSDLSVWYGQAGTPELTVSTSYSPSDRTYSITCTQKTSGKPVLMPIAMSLLGADGKDIPLQLQGSEEEPSGTKVLRFNSEKQTFVFVNVPEEPVPSLLRDFSAPVKMTIEGQTAEQLLFLLANDTDPYNRWEAGQRIAKMVLLDLYDAATNPKNGPSFFDRLTCATSALELTDRLADAFKAVIEDTTADKAFIARTITLPSVNELYDLRPMCDPVAFHSVRVFAGKAMAARLEPTFRAALAANDSTPGEAYSPDAASSGRRALKNKALGYLSMLERQEINQEILQRFRDATNMTDQIAALAALMDHECPERGVALEEFFAKWQHEPLVVLKWFSLQAGSDLKGNVAAVRELVNHPSFNIKNPNNCYSLFLAFSNLSTVNFHDADGSGYAFMGEMIRHVDKINAQVAARMVSCFTTWRRMDSVRQAKMKEQLELIVAEKGISDNTFEIASKSLE